MNGSPLPSVEKGFLHQNLLGKSKGGSFNLMKLRGMIQVSFTPVSFRSKKGDSQGKKVFMKGGGCTRGDFKK